MIFNLSKFLHIVMLAGSEGESSLVGLILDFRYGTQNCNTGSLDCDVSMSMSWLVCGMTSSVPVSLVIAR